jgi:hypothetical protein
MPVNECHGVSAFVTPRRSVTSAGQVGIMESWNIGFDGLGSVFIGLADIKKIKSDPYPPFILNIPYFHNSIIPWVF